MTERPIYMRLIFPDGFASQVGVVASVPSHGDSVMVENIKYHNKIWLVHSRFWRFDRRGDEYSIEVDINITPWS